MNTIDVSSLIADINDRYQSKKSQASYCEWVVSKSNASSRKYMLRGNELTEEKDFYLALESYTKSVSLAADDSEEAAFAYYNRARCLFHLMKFDSCCLDTMKALNNDNGSQIIAELSDLQKLCFKYIPMMKKTDREVSGFDDETQQTEHEHPSVPMDDSDVFANIELDSDENWGRFMKAKRDIQPVEVLSSEKWFSMAISSGRRYKNCSHCLKQCSALIPCSSCDQMMYCSKNCRMRANKSYHRIECQLISLKEIREFSEYQMLVLRTFLIGTEQGSRLKTIMNEISVEDIFAEETDPREISSLDDYLTVLRLCRTYDPKLVSWAINFAAELIVVLRIHSEYFLDSLGRRFIGNETHIDCPSEAELFAALLLVNHAISLTYNQFPIREMNVSDFEEHIGSGVCVLHSFINHSCDPNAFFITRKGVHHVMSLRPIQKGEQIFVSYIPRPMQDFTKEERLETLSANYNFSCSCVACIESWPAKEEIEELQITFKPVINGNAPKVVRTLIKTLFPIVKKNTRADDVMMKSIGEYSKWLHANMVMPSADVTHCEGILVNYTMLLYDDYFCRNHFDDVDLHLSDLLKSSMKRIFELRK